MRHNQRLLPTHLPSTTIYLERTFCHSIPDITLTASAQRRCNLPCNLLHVGGNCIKLCAGAATYYCLHPLLCMLIRLPQRHSVQPRYMTAAPWMVRA